MADDPRLTAIRARLEHYKYELLPAPYDGVRQDYREHVQDLLDLVASHARAVEGQEGWRDIATVPLDGTQVVIDRPVYGPIVASYHGDAWMVNDVGPMDRVTQWVPLPVRMTASRLHAPEPLIFERTNKALGEAMIENSALRAALAAKDQQLKTLLDYGEGMKANLAAKDHQIAHLHGLYDDVGQQRTDAIAALIQARQQLAALRDLRTPQGEMPPDEKGV